MSDAAIMFISSIAICVVFAIFVKVLGDFNDSFSNGDDADEGGPPL